MNRAEEIKSRIAKLQAELDGLEPYETMGVREIARAADISPATAGRFKAGRTIDVPTIKKLIKAKCLSKCPCCGHSLRALLSEGEHND